jgi:hypothetical protein
VASSSYENWIEESTHRQESRDNSAAREAAKSGVEEGVQELQNGDGIASIHLNE